MLTLARALIRLLAVCPLWLLQALAWPLGLALYGLPWRKHRVIAVNLRLCFPDWNPAQRRALHRRYLVELFKLVLEAGVMWHWSPARLDRHLRIEGFDQVAALRADGRGLLFVSGHVGNWELLNLIVSRHLPMATLYRAPEDTALDRFITEPRVRFGGRMIASGSPALRELLTALRQGDGVGIAADIQPKSGDGVFVPYFGQPALTMTLVNRLARKTGAAVVFCWAERLPYGRGWQLRFQQAPEIIAGEDPAAALAPMNAWLEAAVRQAPAQYLWLYKRFSRQPDGSKPYRKA